jgi:hypothetical protein
MSKYTTIDAIERMSGAFPLRNLGVNELLRQSLSSINLIEICFSQAEAFSGRVKCWRSGTMAPRWCASALLWSEKKFRRVRGQRHLRALQEALQKEILERKSQAAQLIMTPDSSTIYGTCPSSNCY